MAPRESYLFKFVMDALMSETYKSYLYWIDTNQGKFCLKCILRSNKNWTPSSSKIFDDYHNLKPRRGNDRRQRFLVAMQACPFITYLKDESSKEEKYYKIQIHGTLPAGEIDAVFPADEDMDGQTSQIIHTNEDRCASGVANVENYVRYSQSENDLDNQLNPLLIDSNYSVPNDIAQLLSNLEKSNVDLTVPDAVANDPEYPENGDSIFKDSVHLMGRSSSCDQALKFTDNYTLPAKEHSYSFEVRAENDFPINYDPTNDLIQSLETPKPVEKGAIYSFANPKTDSDLLGNVQMISETSGETRKCEFEGVYRIDDNDGIMKLLQRDRDFVGDNQKKHFYMMVLKPKTM